MSERKHLDEAVLIMRGRHGIGPEISDERIAGMMGTQRMALTLAMWDLNDAIVESFPRPIRRLVRWVGRPGTTKSPPGNPRTGSK